MDLPLPNQSYQTRSKPLSSQRLVNLYCETYQDSGVMKTKSLINTPGLKTFKDFVLTGSRSQGIRYFRTALIIVLGNKIYTIAESGTSNLIYDATTYESGSDDVDFTDNGQNMMITFASGNAYVINFYADVYSVLKITNQVFNENLAGSCAYCAGRFFYSYLETGTIGYSDLLDAQTWQSLNYFQCEDSPDKITKIMANNRDLLAFHPKGISFYYPTGGTDVIAKNTNVFVDKGCEAKFSICVDSNIFYYLGIDGVVYSLNGYTPQKISTPALENAIEGYSDFSNARASVYSQQGHRFYILKFPSDNKTWVYDINNGLWHERYSYEYISNDLQENEWRGDYVCTAWNGKPYATDSFDGIVYSLDLDYGQDGTLPIVRKFVFPTLNNETKRAFYRRLKLDMDCGIGATETTIMLTYSDDGGYSWVSEAWRPALNSGNFGEYKKRVEWRSLGSSKERTFAVTISSIEKINVLAAYLDVEGAIY